MNIKLAEALLRRKEIREKLDVLETIKRVDMFEVRAKRLKVTDDIDDIVAEVPKLTLSQFTKEYDFIARQLREIDSIIQQANWTVEVEVKPETMATFTS